MDAFLAGTLNVTLVDGFVPAHGARFNLFIREGAVTGEFATTNMPALENGLEWNTSLLHTTGHLTVIPEDANAPPAALRMCRGNDLDACRIESATSAAICFARL